MCAHRYYIENAFDTKIIQKRTTSYAQRVLTSKQFIVMRNLGGGEG